jgi:diguanylate cyclase (GGDEF)-like protein
MEATPAASRADILVVDDNPANIELLVAILGAQGYRCRVANNGARAIAAIELDPPDLVMLDIAMPKMDGYEVCRRIKADPRTRALPVIFLSALNGAIDKVQAFSAGGADYVGKPFQIEEVLARVELQLRLAGALRELEQRNAELARANAQLRQLSQSDGLTGVANRRRFDEALAEAWTAAAGERRELALVLVDIDHFKSFNDRFGHLVGDDCLKRVAHALHDEVAGAGGLVARYGGEEFAILLAHGGREPAQALAERLRERVAREALRPIDAAQLPLVTISVGVAALQAEAGVAPERLVEAADQALYRAKQGGRNRVCA